MRFSVIIPLEFHRGLAVQCVRGWTDGQTYPRNAYELLVAAPDDHDTAEIAEIEAVLGPHDRLLRLPHHHDMPLMADAARQASGEMLVFTESHCLPEPDFLEQAEKVLAERSDWAGFSGRSIAITHNLLSEIEADMYQHAMSRNLLHHPWLKVLDACFVVRSEAYRQVGGLEPFYGHFAEWLLAARLHRRGLVIGHDPRAAIRHYYIGDLHELEEFSQDFTIGQMRFAEASATDLCGDLFDEIPEWTHRHRWSREAVEALTRLLSIDFAHMIRSLGHSRSSLQRFVAWPWRTCLRWWGRRLVPTQSALSLLRLDVVRHRSIVRWQLWRSDRERARAAFLRLIDASIREARRRYLTGLERTRTDAGQDCSEWVPGACDTYSHAGFWNTEQRFHLPLRWSEPAAMVWLPRMPGEWTCTIEWAGFNPPPTLASARFYVDDRPLPQDRIGHRGGITDLSLPPGGDDPRRLSWVCDRFHAPGDFRELGLPVSRISWNERSAPAAVPAFGGENSTIPLESVYFLHVPKAAGTSLRLMLVNGYSAPEMLAPYNGSFYYAFQLDSHPEIREPYAYANGHFGMELPSRVTDREWRIMTVAREPLERLLSFFDYLRQHRRLDRSIDFRTWFEREVVPDDMAIAYFAPGMRQVDAKGAAAVRQVQESFLEAAVGSLARCEVVGLQERLEDTVNLLCATLDRLPPIRMGRVNATLHRTRRSQLDTATVSWCEAHLGPERAFYDEATRIFTSQLTTLHERIEDEAGERLDTDSMRRFLRSRYFQRRSEELSGVGRSTVFHWRPEDAFTGFNLHDRERHAGQSLRWTGPADETVFHVAIDTSHVVHIEMALHPASPMTNVNAARLIVNGDEAPLECRLTDAGPVLWASFRPARPSGESGLFSEFRFLVPTTRGVGEFRDLGVALCGITIDPAIRPDESIRPVLANCSAFRHGDEHEPR